jgi:hypothetical protein
MIQVGKFDRRTGLLAGVAAIMLIVVVSRWIKDQPAATPAVPAAALAVNSVPLAERRLDSLRAKVGTVAGKQAVTDKAAGEVATREKGMLKADTAAQAQAELIEVIRRVASSNGIDARGAESFAIKPLGSDYGEVSVQMSFPCRIEQLVNFLSTLANEPELLSTSEVHVNGGTDKKKNVQVRLVVSGVVPRKLLPQKKGGTTF